MSGVDKQRVINKKHTKSTYNQRLARSPKENNNRLKLAQSDKLEDREKLKNKNGRKSFAEIAVEKNLLNDITEALFWWCADNPYYSQKELMDFLMTEFKEVFIGCKTKYPQSFYKNIEKVDAWYEAMRSSCVPSSRQILRSLYKDAISGEMVHKDAMNLVRLMHDVEVWKKEDSNIEQDSKETQKTLLTIDRACSPDEPDEDEDGE